MKRNKAIFIDKDGTLIKNVSHNVDINKVTFLPGSLTVLKELQQQGFFLIIITNQPGISLGYFTVAELENLKRRLINMLKKHHISLDGFYYCPHYPFGIVTEHTKSCVCRKPLPGLIFNACDDFDIDAAQSWMIGDILNDVEAGNRAGCNTILLDNGNETEWQMSDLRRPHYIVHHWNGITKIVGEKVYGV